METDSDTIDKLVVERKGYFCQTLKAYLEEHFQHTNPREYPTNVRALEIELTKVHNMNGYSDPYSANESVRKHQRKIQQFHAMVPLLDIFRDSRKVVAEMMEAYEQQREEDTRVFFKTYVIDEDNTFEEDDDRGRKSTHEDNTFEEDNDQGRESTHLPELYEMQPVRKQPSRELRNLQDSSVGEARTSKAKKITKTKQTTRLTG